MIEEEVSAALEESAMACLSAGIPYWWVHAHFDGVDDAEYYAAQYPPDADDTTPVLQSVPCATYDAMVAECVARNRAAGTRRRAVAEGARRVAPDVVEQQEVS